MKFLKSFLSALLSPLGFAWLCVMVFLGALMLWCFLTYDPFRVSAPQLSVIDIPPFDQDFQDEALEEEDIEAPADNFLDETKDINQENHLNLHTSPAKGDGEDGQASETQKNTSLLKRFSKSAAYGKVTGPKIAVVLKGVGLDYPLAKRAIEELPGSVTLAFSPYSQDLPGLLHHAALKGHESLLMVPTESDEPSEVAPGDLTLMHSEALFQYNEQVLLHLLELGEGGIVGMGLTIKSKSAVQPHLLRLLVKHLKAADGLVFNFGPEATQELSALCQEEGIVCFADKMGNHEEASRIAIEKKLKTAEEQAIKKGFAIAVVSSYPVTIKYIQPWIRTLKKKGVTLVPVTGIIGEKKID